MPPCTLCAGCHYLDSTRVPPHTPTAPTHPAPHHPLPAAPPHPHPPPAHSYLSVVNSTPATAFHFPHRLFYYIHICIINSVLPTFHSVLLVSWIRCGVLIHSCISVSNNSDVVWAYLFFVNCCVFDTNVCARTRHGAARQHASLSVPLVLITCLVGPVIADFWCPSSIRRKKCLVVSHVCHTTHYTLFPFFT